jgi:hypothetical protein
MNKLLFLIVTGILISSVTIANQSELFSYDKERLAIDMSGLQQMEDYICMHDGVTFGALQESGNELAGYLRSGASQVDEPEDEEEVMRLMRIPSYLWGCCLGPVGAIVVYIALDDSDETRKSFMGCVTWGFGLTAYYIIAKLSIFY